MVENPDPASFGVNPYDETRYRIIEEVDAMKKQALATGNKHHIPAMENLEASALHETEKNHKEE